MLAGEGPVPLEQTIVNCLAYRKKLIIQIFEAKLKEN